MATTRITGKQRAARKRNIKVAQLSKKKGIKKKSIKKKGGKPLHKDVKALGGGKFSFKGKGSYDKSIIRMMTPSKPRKPKSLRYQWDKKRKSKSLHHQWEKKRDKLSKL
jgi:hypothetical protein